MIKSMAAVGSTPIQILRLSGLIWRLARNLTTLFRIKMFHINSDRVVWSSGEEHALTCFVDVVGIIHRPFPSHTDSFAYFGSEIGQKSIQAFSVPKNSV